MKENLDIYVDGGARLKKIAGEPLNIGGWGVVFVFRKRAKQFNGKSVDPKVTNNMMELTAMLVALEKMEMYLKYIDIKYHIKPNNINITIYSDSEYTVEGINSRLDKWIAAGWKLASKKPVKNKTLWGDLYKLRNKHVNLHISYKWIKGHSDDKGNDMADKLATQAMNNVFA